MLKKYKLVIKSILAMLVVAIFANTALAQPSQMPLLERSSQPVGHYEFCQQYQSECQPNPPAVVPTLTEDLWSQLIEVNGSVNTVIIPRTDEEIFGVAERWAYPTKQGDCEDFALLKQYMLQRAGVPRSALLITVLRQRNGAGHAVLTVRTSEGDFVLDNLDERILPWNETDYLYLKRQSELDSGKWIGIADDRDILVGSVR
ncbi:transglutaminase-like cysteine peptidase [Aurantimonas litoralis]|nr:transglutaminase-like cysteine peptidase [Aurantimonas litoralis]